MQSTDIIAKFKKSFLSLVDNVISLCDNVILKLYNVADSNSIQIKTVDVLLNNESIKKCFEFLSKLQIIDNDKSSIMKTDKREALSIDPKDVSNAYSMFLNIKNVCSEIREFASSYCFIENLIMHELSENILLFNAIHDNIHKPDLNYRRLLLLDLSGEEYLKQRKECHEVVNSLFKVACEACKASMSINNDIERALSSNSDNITNINKKIKKAEILIKNKTDEILELQGCRDKIINSDQSDIDLTVALNIIEGQIKIRQDVINTAQHDILQYEDGIKCNEEENRILLLQSDTQNKCLTSIGGSKDMLPVMQNNIDLFCLVLINMPMQHKMRCIEVLSLFCTSGAKLTSLATVANEEQKVMKK